MPRHARLDIQGAIHHVMTRGLNGQNLFLNDSDRDEFLKRLQTALEKTSCKCYAWVLMSNHVHLLIRTGTGSLSDLLRKLLTGYAVYFNRKHQRRGYLYQNRYKSIICQEDAYLLELVRYVHLNPMRAKIVKDIHELDLYKWSGHAVIVGKIERPWQIKDEILLLFNKSRGKAISQYRDFIKDGLRMGERSDLAAGGLRRSAGGWKGVNELKKEREYWRGDERILGDESFVEKVLQSAHEDMEKKERLKRNGWDLRALTRKASKLLSINPQDIKKKGRANNISAAKGILCYWAYKYLGISTKALSESLGISRYGVLLNVERGKHYSKKNNINLLS